MRKSFQVRDLDQLRGETPTFLAIGVFDGVHLGHQQLIERMVAEADRQGARPAVLTFYPHPGKIISGRSGRLYLSTLDERAALHDRAALTRILIVLGGTILLFFVHNLLHLQPGFVALLGAAAALLWVQPADVEEVLKHVEWPVLMFFAALFVTVGGIEASGLLNLLAEEVIALATQDMLLTGVAVIWGSAILSAIMDNIPFTIVMIPVIQDLGLSTGLSITPLWWALALGAGFGGNGTIIGSTANVITVAVSEKTSTPITSKIWMKTGLPVMVATLLVATILFVLRFDSLQ